MALMAENSESIDGNDTVWPHNLHTSVANVPHLEKYSRTCDRNLVANQGGDMEDLEVNTSILRIFMTATLQAAVHLGNDYVENLLCTQNQLERTLKPSKGSERNPRNISDQLAATNLAQDNFLTDKAVQLSNAKTYVFSDSVLCMGRISGNPVKGLKEKIDWFQNTLQNTELDRIDGEPMEF